MISGKIGYRQDFTKNVNFLITSAILNLFLPNFIMSYDYTHYFYAIK